MPEINEAETRVSDLNSDVSEPDSSLASADSPAEASDEDDGNDEDDHGNGNGDSGTGGRRHGRSFTYLSLEDAEKAVRKIDGNERRMAVTPFAQALGHKKPIGRFKQKLAALESYGLIQVEDDNVKLTELAVDMLYGPTKHARTCAKATAFLKYDLFKETFVQCPKNQDHQLSYVDDFVRVTLKIVNERDTFLKRFLESARFAGLLEGEPDPSAKSIRLRPAVAAPSNGESADAAQPAVATPDQWVIVAPDDTGSLLDGFGLTAYQDRCDVSQLAAGEITINMADGKITVEVRRPVRVVIKTSNMLDDVTAILKALQAKGFKT